MEKIIKAVAKPFTAFHRGPHQFAVAPDGTVRVYDSVANYYTTCHSLSQDAQRRIRKLAS